MKYINNWIVSQAVSQDQYSRHMIHLNWSTELVQISWVSFWLPYYAMAAAIILNVTLGVAYSASRIFFFFFAKVKEIATVAQLPNKIIAVCSKKFKREKVKTHRNRLLVKLRMINKTPLRCESNRVKRSFPFTPILVDPRNLKGFWPLCNGGGGCHFFFCTSGS